MKAKFAEMKANSSETAAVISINGMNYAGLEKDAYRAFYNIVYTLRKAKKGAKLTVQEVVQRLDKLQLRARYTGTAGRKIINSIIDDVEMKGFSDEEKLFVGSYRAGMPKSSLTNIELRTLLREGYVIGGTGHIVQKFNPPRFTQKIVNHPDPSKQGQGTESIHLPEDFKPEDSPEMRKLLGERQSYREERDALKKAMDEKEARGETLTKEEIDTYNKSLSKVSRKSEQIGEESLDQMMQGEGFILMYPLPGAKSSGSGDLDRIYVREINGRFQVVEVKGGSSTFGSRRVVNVKRGINPGDRAQQGSGVYLLDVVLEMRRSKDRAKAAMGDELLQGLQTKRVDYIYYRQKISDEGKLGQRTIEQFDISDLPQYLN
jgi:hypothetical protein